MQGAWGCEGAVQRVACAPGACKPQCFHSAGSQGPQVLQRCLEKWYEEWWLGWNGMGTDANGWEWSAVQMAIAKAVLSLTLCQGRQGRWGGTVCDTAVRPHNGFEFFEGRKIQEVLIAYSMPIGPR